MFANELIGKKAIRTKPCKLSNDDDQPGMGLMMGMIGTRKATQDYSYSSTPIYILATTESHIVYRHVGIEEKIFGSEPSILDGRWCDDGWTDYDGLMKLAEPATVELMAKAHEIMNGAE